jgi:hypothetical protein
MKSDIEVEGYLRNNADRIIKSLKLILIGMSRDEPLSLCKQLFMWMVREDYKRFKVWFTPDRFGIEYLYTSTIYSGVDYVEFIKLVHPTGLFQGWYKYRIEDIPALVRPTFYWYPLTWYPLSLGFNGKRAGILEKAIAEFENEFKKDVV